MPQERPPPVTTEEGASPSPSTLPAELFARSPPPPIPRQGEDGGQDSPDNTALYVEAGTKTVVAVTATAYDDRPGGSRGDVGCGEAGCAPALAHDGVGKEDLESRWSCAKDLVPHGGQCQIEFVFGYPQDIMDIEVAFYKGDQRDRTLKVRFHSWWHALLVGGVEVV